jgi:hypothetical protein
MSEPEAWLSGPIDGVSASLMPVAHALVQARRDITRAVTGLNVTQIWARPGGVAAVGFHLRHLAGSTDRLRSYAEGKTLTPEQRAVLGAEGEPGTPPAAAGELLTGVDAAIDEVLEVLRATPDGDLDLPRKVGRARLPTTVRGLLYHIGEHAARHAGQVVTTAKVVAAE